MYAMTGKLVAQPGMRAVFVAILVRAAHLVGEMPGCHLYIVTEDQTDANAIHIFEMWDDRAAHDASLTDERVRALIAEARPLMGGPPEGAELRVVGGHGIPQ